MGSRNLARVSDAKLVRLARDGDVRAFEELYGRHHPAILSFCRHLTGRLEDAEDAVQHTFLNAYFALTGDGPELDLKPWLFTVARNRCISLLRSRRIREPQPALRTAAHPLPSVDEAPADAWGTDGLAEEVERREDLRELVADLGELPEPQRAALVLSELEALSHAEIAQVLHVAPAKVRALVFQARSSLLSTREARDTPCGEIRMQISTLRGPSLRRRTLRRHVRACPGCRDFEAAVRVQRHDLALILPVVAASTMRDGLPSGLAGGAAGSGAATGGSSGGGAVGAGAATGGSSGGGAVGGGLAGSGAAGGGAAAVGAGAAAGGGAAVGGGGLLSGIVAAVAGGGAVQLTAVVAVAAAGTVGAVKADVPHRLGMTGAIGPEHAQVRQERDHRSQSGGKSLASTDAAGDSAGQPGARAGGGGEAGGPNGSPKRPGAGKPADASGRRSSTPPEPAKRDGDVPPGLANRDGGVAPGLVKKDGEPPPGWERRGGGNGNGGNGHGNGNGNGGNGNSNSNSNSRGNVNAGNGNGGNGGHGGNGGNGGNAGAKPKSTPPVQSNQSHPDGTPPGQSKDSQPGSQAPKSAPPGQSSGAPPGQPQKEDGTKSTPPTNTPGNSEKPDKSK